MDEEPQQFRLRQYEVCARPVKTVARQRTLSSSEQSRGEKMIRPRYTIATNTRSVPDTSYGAVNVFKAFSPQDLLG